jgi:protein TonB
MKRRFAYPLAIAVTVEAVLLLCFNGKAIASPAAPVQPIDPYTHVWPAPDDTPTIVPNTDQQDSSPASARPAPPTQVEPPPASDKGAIPIDTPPAQPPSTTTSYRIETALPNAVTGGQGTGSGFIDVRLLDNAPKVSSQKRPTYPYGARHDSLEGKVLVEFVVDYSGRVLNPRVVSSTNSIFEEPTLQAVSQWRFEPGRRDGRTVRFRMMVPVEFHLDGD